MEFDSQSSVIPPSQPPSQPPQQLKQEPDQVAGVNSLKYEVDPTQVSSIGVPAPTTVQREVNVTTSQEAAGLSDASAAVMNAQGNPVVMVQSGIERPRTYMEQVDVANGEYYNPDLKRRRTSNSAAQAVIPVMIATNPGGAAAENAAAAIPAAAVQATTGSSDSSDANVDCSQVVGVFSEVPPPMNSEVMFSPQKGRAGLRKSTETRNVNC